MLYLFTPRSTFLLEKLTGSVLVKKFPAFYGTRMFINAFTTARYLSLYWVTSIQSINSPLTSWRRILLLSSHPCLVLPSGLFPLGFPTNVTLTYLRSRVLLEKLTSSQLVKKFPAIYRTRKFITTFTSASHLFQSKTPPPTSWRSVLILFLHVCLGFPRGLFPSGLPTKTYIRLSSLPLRATYPAYLILLGMLQK